MTYISVNIDIDIDDVKDEVLESLSDKEILQEMTDRGLKEEFDKTKPKSVMLMIKSLLGLRSYEPIERVKQEIEQYLITGRVFEIEALKTNKVD